ncbi:sterol desaturase family protein [Streptomyces physcomitrii]|uniref:sterol desaturase family protein n=1 Tax=Streptomyces physcomitrii TaxID=2724184 RepID=UPI0033F1A3EB
MPAEVWEQINNPVLYAIPFFLLFIGIEVAALARLDDEGLKGYLGKDSLSSLSMGSGALVVMALFKAVTLVLYAFLWSLVPWHIPTGAWWHWPLLLLVVDLAWYANHRFSHRVRFGWAGHQAHHSSEYFNLGTALRQKWNPWTEALFWVPLPLMGFAPWTIYVAFALNLIYQFFTHTEAVGKLPRPVEFVLNTPSHHRVHHGSDPEYLDKNYGGILIVWDRLLGTFQEELHRPTYGLTTPVGTYNVIRLQYHEYGSMIADVRRARRLRDKLGYVFGPPGWRPADTAPAPAPAATPAPAPAPEAATAAAAADVRPVRTTATRG